MLILLVPSNFERYLIPKFGTPETFVLMAASCKAFLHASLSFDWEPFIRLNLDRIFLRNTSWAFASWSLGQYYGKRVEIAPWVRTFSIMAYLELRLVHLPNFFTSQVTIFWAIWLMFVMFNSSRNISSLDPITKKSWAPSFSFRILSLHHCCYFLTHFCSFLVVNWIWPTLSSCTHSLSSWRRVKFVSSTTCLSTSFVACCALCGLGYGPCRKCPTHCPFEHHAHNTLQT